MDLRHHRSLHPDRYRKGLRHHRRHRRHIDRVGLVRYKKPLAKYNRGDFEVEEDNSYFYSVVGGILLALLFLLFILLEI
jgi:hypothetical protein